MDTTDSMYTTSSSDAAGAAMGIGMLIFLIFFYLAIFIVMGISMWRLFVKAGKPGWAAIVPIYNNVIQLKIIGRPLWWLAMMFIPFANIAFAVMILIDFCKSYGKDTGFAILAILFPLIMLPYMAFSKDIKYVGPVGPERHNFSSSSAPQPPVNPAQ